MEALRKASSLGLSCFRREKTPGRRVTCEGGEEGIYAHCGT
jgi:hypothetical protein